MLQSVLDVLIGSEPFERLLVERARPIVARAEAGVDALLAALARALESPVLAVTPGPREAEILARGVGAFLGPERAALFPAWEALPYEGISPSPETASRRAEAARALRRARGPFVLVTPAHAALTGLVPSIGQHDPLVLAAGATVASDGLAERLVDLGYVRSEVVEHRGEFALRGGIVDVFPGTARRPVRLELFGDEVESLREFVPATQLSTDRVHQVEIHPVRELRATPELREHAERLAPRVRDRFRDALTRFADGLLFEGMEGLAPLLFDRLPTIADLLPPGSWTVLAQARRTLDRARQAVDEATQLAEASGWPGPAALRPLEEALGERTRLHLSEFAEGIDLGLEGWGTAQGNAPELARRLTELAARGYRVVVTAAGHGSLERAREVVTEHGLELDGDRHATAEADLAGGFVFAPGRLGVATEEDLFGSRRHTRAAPRITRRRADALALELQPGDFAVHRVHGVGRFVGVQRRAVAGAERDYLVLEYAAGDRLSVPTDQVGMVAKYLGGEEPRLTRLGTNDWVRTTRRVKRAVKDMAGELVRLYSVRMSVEGHAFGPDTPWQREMEDAFPYEETRDQVSAIDEVKRDMERPKP
ncbi:MAG: CarD family transcriptional regulator, partial [Candidatus Velamenicoccus archaeovorus]